VYRGGFREKGNERECMSCTRYAARTSGTTVANPERNNYNVITPLLRGRNTNGTAIRWRYYAM